jgi:hypothetical protein
MVRWAGPFVSQWHNERWNRDSPDVARSPGVICCDSVCYTRGRSRYGYGLKLETGVFRPVLRPRAARGGGSRITSANTSGVTGRMNCPRCGSVTSLEPAGTGRASSTLRPSNEPAEASSCPLCGQALSGEPDDRIARKVAELERFGLTAGGEPVLEPKRCRSLGVRSRARSNR